MEAEEIVETIMTLVNLPSKFDKRNGIPESVYHAVKKEIESFGRETRKKAMQEWYYKAQEGMIQYVRSKALEEAAKVVQNFKWANEDDKIDGKLTELLAVKIRALIKE